MTSKSFRLIDHRHLPPPALAVAGAALVAASPHRPRLSNPRRRHRPRPIRAPPSSRRSTGIKLEDVRMTPVNGIYEITRGSGDQLHCRADGRYAIVGDMIDLDSDANLSENRRRGIRAAHDRDRSGNRDAGVLAQGSEVHRSRCSPTSTAAIAAACTRRSPNTTGSASACATCSSRAPGPTPSPGTRPKPCGARRIATRR